MNRIHHFALDELVIGSLNLTEVRSTDHPEVRSALHFIASNLDNNLTINDVADKLQISRRTLELRFRRHLDCTVESIVTRFRVEAARRLLVETDLTAGDISVDVGFSSISGMSNALQKSLGMTSSEIRAAGVHSYKNLQENIPPLPELRGE